MTPQAGKRSGTSALVVACDAYGKPGPMVYKFLDMYTRSRSS
jgi:hypothetical protein